MPKRYLRILSRLNSQSQQPKTCPPGTMPLGGLTPTSYAAQIPPMPVEIRGLNEATEVRHAVLTRIDQGRELCDAGDLRSSMLRCAVELPTGERLAITCGRRDMGTAGARLWALAETARAARPGLVFWGCEPAHRQAGQELRLWLDAGSATAEQAATIEHKWVADTLMGLRVTLPDAPNLAPRLIASRPGQAATTTLVAPVFTPDRMLSFEIVPALAAGGRALDIRVFHAPSVAGSFWHYAARCLHDGARALGRHLLNGPADGLAPESHAYACAAYSLHYGSSRDMEIALNLVDRVLDDRALVNRVPPATLPIRGGSAMKSALIRMRGMIATGLGTELTPADLAALMAAFGASSAEPPLSEIERSHMRAALARHAPSRSHVLEGARRRSHAPPAAHLFFTVTAHTVKPHKDTMRLPSPELEGKQSVPATARVCDVESADPE